ncbi:MBL fold metallo-hydrolase RNA specificity domain-containing protein [Flavobacterium gilvum]|uniref:MBL fold metallo-hydrolase n=1 Tax=Flavobacterium gilvum TaxID=1492737 RepID=A0AAC9I5N0_9FLAO|nr:MBL fold metallo-hydrolase [Flavobacterium gilvum]AOW09303.1 MBL fold metallo-hydrolase [Flavobacterium gilvum]KFC59547.1 metallo-beta-lactamase [Flavobacterium gilvum]
MKITCIGGVGTVTGSKTLVESNGLRILIDCGQFQGLKQLRELNWEPLPILPSTIDFVLLTHGHLDHCGWLPRLINQGFSGKIYCSAPTAAVSKLILLDSAKIQEEDAKMANEGKYSKHEIAEPLYTVEQAEKVFSHFQIIQPNENVVLEEGIEAVFTNAGHILGACSIELRLENKVVVFSGDIGRDNDLLMFSPTKPKKADYVFLESTYGNRLHPDTDPKTELEKYINDAIQNQGTVIIPSFAVERAQSVMYLLWQLKEEKRIPDIPYIVDTPMGISMLELFINHKKWHRLPQEEFTSMCKMFTMVSDYKETIEVIYNKQPKVVIVASGMVTGGRVLSYLERYVGLPETTVVIIGYQGEGTRGRKMLDGAKDIKIRGKYYELKSKVVEIETLSAHGDQKDLMNWLSELEEKPKKVFLVHGENEAADELRIKIKEEYGFECVIPWIGQEFEL